MKVQFKHILPNPLTEIDTVNSDVWKVDYIWESPNKTMLSAVSGKGKSTFVNILTGVRKDFNGDLIIDSKATSEFSTDDWSLYRSEMISTVYQDLQLFDKLTVLENIQVKNELTNHFSLEKINTLIDQVGLTSHINKQCQNLSFGQRQRVAIIRALAQPFKLLLMDEPFSHLDKQNEEIITKLILEELDANNAGLIITSLGEYPLFKVDNEINL